MFYWLENSTKEMGDKCIDLFRPGPRSIKRPLHILASLEEARPSASQDL
jgi:hypothetical protein